MANTSKKKKEISVNSSKTYSPIQATTLLRAEASRLDVLKHAMPDDAQEFMETQVWAYQLAATFLESLGAPEKIQKYIPYNK